MNVTAHPTPAVVFNSSCTVYLILCSIAVKCCILIAIHYSESYLITHTVSPSHSQHHYSSILVVPPSLPQHDLHSSPWFLFLCVDVPFQNYCDLSDAAQRYWAMQKKVVRQSGLLSICISLLGESEGGGSSDDMKDIIAEEGRGEERRGSEKT